MTAPQRFTHLLRCAHQVGRNRTEYQMPCVILKKMPGQRVKIRVFGERFWAGRDARSRIRYVSKSRVTPMREQQQT